MYWLSAKAQNNVKCPQILISFNKKSNNIKIIWRAKKRKEEGGRETQNQFELAPNSQYHGNNDNLMVNLIKTS